MSDNTDIEAAEQPNARRRKLLAGVVTGCFLLAFLLVFWFVGRPMLAFVSEPEKFRAWVERSGAWGQLAYVGMVFFQVLVAIIPGEPLEIGGGYAFGALEGTLLCMLGATLGSLLVFAVVRRFGMRLVLLFFSREKLQSLRFLQTSHKRNVLFLLVFMTPGTPKDLLCYFAGLTDMKLPAWLLISSLGRIPSIVTSTIGGDALGMQNYQFAVAAFLVTMLISVSGLFLYQVICKRHGKRQAERQAARAKAFPACMDEAEEK